MPSALAHRIPRAAIRFDVGLINLPPETKETIVVGTRKSVSGPADGGDRRAQPKRLPLYVAHPVGDRRPRNRRQFVKRDVESQPGLLSSRDAERVGFLRRRLG